MTSFLAFLVFLVQAASQSGVRTPAALGTIAGHILNLSDKPAAGERVAALAVGSGGSALMSIARADSAGNYRLENLPAGQYYVIAGFTDSPTYYPGVSVPSTAKVIGLTAGGRIADIDFKMSPHSGVTVAIRVIRPPEQLAHSTDAIRLNSGQSVALQTTAAADGTFVFPRVRPGTYTMEFISNPSVLSPIPLDVPDHDLTDVEIRVPAAVPIHVKAVVNGVGVVTNSIVSVVFTGKRFSLSIPVSAAGPASSFLADAEEYSVRTTAELPALEVVSVMSGDRNLHFDLLEVDRKPPPEIVVTMRVRDPVRVSGRLLTPLGPPSPPGKLSMGGGTGGIAFEADVRNDGSFEFAGVPQGSYTLRLDSAPSTASFSIKVGKNGLDDVRLYIPAFKGVRILARVEGGGVVPPFHLLYTGTVAAGRAPVSPSPSDNVFPSIQVTVLGDYFKVVPSPAGSAVITMQEGDYRMGAEVPPANPDAPPEYRLKSILSGGKDTRQSSVRVSAESDVEIRIVLEAVR